MLKLKLQYFGHLMRRIESLEKTLMLGKIEGGRRMGTTEDEMAGWPHFNSLSLLKLMSIELVMSFNYLILCCLLIPLPSIFPSIRIFSNESVLRIRWPKYWSFSFSFFLHSVLPMNIHDWFPLGLTGWISLQPKELSRDFGNNTVQKHQFFGVQLSL